ncbi:hypothetical protein C1H76_2023 [Elsinoe australis]|uniref:DUF4470 domain-containing protein n=1 Tax=Elsinoe australis TaxID=40998 RepID=A0A4U7BBP9_9PEZI|nr:hypothetical protein C1H76_2023 [Elsinoe australis]
MLTCTYINRTYFFTPAVNLLAYSPTQEDQRNRLLLLGCGDLRNVLFTLHSQGTSAPGCSFEFTMCDMEGAIHARNVFVLTFLARHRQDTAPGGKNLESIWNAYDHFFITSKNFDVIRDHAKHLLSFADTIEAWPASPYGALIKVSSDFTLSELCKFWKYYTQTKDMRVSEPIGASYKKKMKAVFDIRIGPKGIYAGAAHAVGFHALESIQTINAAFRAYWSTGVIAGNDSDVASLKSDKGGFANPLFAWSSAPKAGFAVHYGTGCIAGFHVAGAFDQTAPQSQQL